jgi:isocitrate dehydrogenase
MEVYAGEKANNQFGTWLPDATVQACRDYLVSIKGPLTTPIGGGIRSLNVALRQMLDLYVCLRPVRWFKGVPSPVKNPSQVDMVIFRENCEDIYAGIEFEHGSDRTRSSWPVQGSLPEGIRQDPLPGNLGHRHQGRVEGRHRAPGRAAIEYAIEFKRKSVTIVHKGNIMKFTEGAFRNWGYALAEREFGDKVYTWDQWERTKAAKGEPKPTPSRRPRSRPAASSSRMRSPTSPCSRC